MEPPDHPGPAESGFGPVAVIEDREAAAVLLKPPRLEILEQLREPDSAAGLARRMGLPRQRLGYHLRELEKHGLLELVEERLKGNCVERVVRSRARYFLVGPGTLGELAADRPERLRDRFSWSYLVAMAAKALRDLSGLRAAADAAGKRLPTLCLETRVHFASSERLHAFSEELSRAIAELVARFHDERAKGGRTFSFFLGAYPTPLAENRADPAPEAMEEER
ncbi:MAG: helix-turn-helix domain-containing protein [Holophagales bacterium]|nr:helix-turn-helix domain-containing protein [Holophagales bacterium]